MEEKKEVTDNAKEEKEKEYHEEITDPKEKEALEKFKNSIATITDKKDKLVIDLYVLLDNDLLIHFLEIIKYKKATKAILEYFHWKAKINLDDIYLNYRLKELYKFQLIMPSCFHKITKDGFPVYYQVMSQFNADEFLKLGTVEEMVKYALNIAEKLEREYFKICSKIKGKYIHGSVSVIDFSGINSSILNTKILSYLKKISKVQIYYPEMLEGSYVVNANLFLDHFILYVKCL